MGLGLRRMQETIEVDQKLPVHGMQVGQQPNQSIMNFRNMDGVALSQSSPGMLEDFANVDLQLKSTMVNSKLVEAADRNEGFKSHEVGTAAEKKHVWKGFGFWIY